MSVMNTNQAPPVHGGDIHVTGGSIAVTRLYDVAYAIDLDRVVSAVEPALELYAAYLEWALEEAAGWD